MSHSKTPTKTVEDHLAWLGTTGCTCPHEWMSYGRLDGFDMGYGWNRMSTAANCPHHPGKPRKAT